MYVIIYALQVIQKISKNPSHPKREPALVHGFIGAKKSDDRITCPNSRHAVLQSKSSWDVMPSRNSNASCMDCCMELEPIHII